MFLILVNFVVFCWFGVHGYAKEFNAEPICGQPFCQTVENYPIHNITRLIVESPTFVQHIKDIEIEMNIGQSKARKKSLCDCNPRTMAPRVGLNVYNIPRFIVNIDQYSQKFKSCSKNLTNIAEFQHTPCSDIRPKDSNYKSMCWPKYQNVMLNAVKDEHLYLDEFYVVTMYKCVFVPKSGL